MMESYSDQEVELCVACARIKYGDKYVESLITETTTDDTDSTEPSDEEDAPLFDTESPFPVG